MMTIDTLWCALNAARIERGISWRRLAAEAGTSPSTVSRMPVRSPSVESYLKLLGWLALHSPDTGCTHDGKVMVGGIGTLKDPPELRTICLQCGRETS